MEKVYDIKIKDLENILDVLKMHSTDSIVVMDIIRLESYINRLNNRFKNPDDSPLIERILDDVEYLEFYKPYYPFVQHFLSLGVSAEELDEDIRYVDFSMSDEQTFSEAENFFKKQGGLIYSQFCDFKREANDHLKFIKPNCESDGESLFLRSIGEAFVFAPNHSNITKFAILVHEIQHVLDFFMNDNFSEYFIIRECTAMFMELIACDYFAKRYNLIDENFKRQFYIHVAVKYQAVNVVNKMEILSIINNNRHLSESELLSLLKQNGFEEEEVRYYFEDSISDDYSYQLSYLIAVELYVLYYKDKNRTLRIIDDIVKKGTPENILEILESHSIVLNQNTEQYEGRLLNKIKR